MQAIEETKAKPAKARHRSGFVRHFVEMVVAMILGMAVLGGLVYGLLSLVGLGDAEIRPEVELFVMALNMSVGMGLWMRHRGHRWSSILEMCGAMFIPFLALFPLLWLDAISVDAMYGWGHVLMLPAMLGVMLRRRHEYAHA
jgi:flagellar biosynthetic protein FliP